MPSRGELERHLRAVSFAARKRWPTIDLDEEDFVRHAIAAYPAELPLAHWAGEEFFLATAVLADDPAAHAVFAAEYLAPLDRVLARFADDGLIEDARQTLAERLLVRTETEAPRIAAFTGRGPLAKWLAVAAVRTAISLQRRARDVPIDDDALVGLRDRLLAEHVDPKLEHLKRTYLAEFQGAWRDTLRELTPRDRTLLRLHLLDRVSVERLGPLYGVHATTAARWVRQVHDRLARGVRARLQAQLAISEDELDSIVRMIHSRMEVSLGALASGSEKTGPER